MAKKKRLKFVIVLLSLVVIIIFAVLSAKNYFEYRNIKSYVFQNEAAMTEFAQRIYQVQNDSFKNYRREEDIPEGIDSDILYSNYRIDSIAVWKQHPEVEDRVKIWFKVKPINKAYYHCGIYYSLNNVAIDYYGKAQEGDVYEYDGVPEKIRIRYKTEKICDHWYYFEEAIWN